jgi:hypothetical protein
MDYYFVSYLVIPRVDKARRYWQHRMFSTDDLATILIAIIPMRRRTGHGKLKAQLKEYQEHRRVTFGTPDSRGVIRYIEIKKLPAADKKVLDKYL